MYKCDPNEKVLCYGDDEEKLPCGDVRKKPDSKGYPSSPG